MEGLWEEGVDKEDVVVEEQAAQDDPEWAGEAVLRLIDLAKDSGRPGPKRPPMQRPAPWVPPRWASSGCRCCHESVGQSHHTVKLHCINITPIPDNLLKSPYCSPTGNM